MARLGIRSPKTSVRTRRGMIRLAEVLNTSTIPTRHSKPSRRGRPPNKGPPTSNDSGSLKLFIASVKMYDAHSRNFDSAQTDAESPEEKREQFTPSLGFGDATRASGTLDDCESRPNARESGNRPVGNRDRRLA